MKKIKVTVVLLLAAIGTGALLFNTLKKAGLAEIFDFDLNEEL